MHKVILLICSFLLGFCVQSEAQDIHFTQYYASPLTLNPAHTGYFYGTARLSGIYRKQGFGDALNGDLFTSFALNVDAPIILGLSERHWVGVGAAMWKDVAGSFDLGISAFHGSVAYHIGLGGEKKKGRSGKGIVSRVKSALKNQKRSFVPSNTYVSIGATYGSRVWSIGQIGDNNLLNEKFIFEGDSEVLSMTKPKATEVGIGVMLSSKMSSTADFQVGLSAFHLLSERLNTVTSVSNTPGNKVLSKEKMKLSGHAELNMILNDKISIHPKLLYRTAGAESETSLQGIVGYRFDEEKDITLFGGIGYRLSGTAQIILGGKIKDLRVGVAYDAATSMYSHLSGIEFSAQYILKIFKTPQADPVIFCPRL